MVNIDFFQRLTRIQRILYGKPLFENEISCLKVWKIEQTTTSSLCLKNRRNSRQYFDKNMKKKPQKVERKLVLAATPSLSGRVGGGEGRFLQNLHLSSSTFLQQKYLKDSRICGQRLGKLTEWQT